MFISTTEKNRIENNLKFLIEEVAYLRNRIRTIEGWDAVDAKKEIKPAKKKLILTPKKRGRPVGSKNKPK